MLKKKGRRRSRLNASIQFDEDNLQTLRDEHKDYGHTKVREAQTPYPRIEDPVDPGLLRQRLLELFEGLDFLKDEEGEKSDSSNEQSPEYKTACFLKKRKEFTLCEFTCTKQKNLCQVKQAPGSSVGNKWRTLSCAKNSISIPRVYKKPSYYPQSPDSGLSSHSNVKQ
uniref:Uncharacterized protein n=1 Tax=Glossina brevipalpis TaxID=37001 RepID=A0A1A9W4F3_9MUSC